MPRLTTEVLEDRRLLADWVPIGPGPIINGQVEHVLPGNQVSGAIHTVLPHPTDPNTVYVGAVNGGVWKTTNATAANPTWVPLTDNLSSLSVTDLDMDVSNPNTIVASLGRASAFTSVGGELSGLQITRDAGRTWTELRDPLLEGQSIYSVEIDGDTILASSHGRVERPLLAFNSVFSQPDSDFGIRSGGLFRSTDGGQTWVWVDLLPRLPAQPDTPVDYNAWDLVGDPTDADRYFVAVQDVGLFRSDDRGATWTNISTSNQALNQAIQFVEVRDDMGVVTLFNQPGANNNTEFAVANNGRIFVAVMEFGKLEYIGYSDDQGTTWTEMDQPFTPDVENAQIVGLQPREKPGSQGGIHFSITVDPNDPNIVYVGGDRQGGNTNNPEGNSIGAKDASGRLFRGDVRLTPNGFNVHDAVLDADNPPTFGQLIGQVSPQWQHLTHAVTQLFMTQGGTASRSAPHADSRDMAFLADGTLVEVDDGGIYKRTSPRNNRGDWFSLNGNLQIAESHDVAYDSRSNIAITGNQDVGTTQQVASGSSTWEHIDFASVDPNVPSIRLNADGGDVAVDDRSNSDSSFRYTSSQQLGFFRRLTYNSNNQLVSQRDIFPINPAIEPQFANPFVLNELNPSRLVLAAGVGLYESMMRGEDNFPIIVGLPIGTDDDGTLTNHFYNGQNAFAYGGTRYGTQNEGIIYAAVNDDVVVRTADGGRLQLVRHQYPGTTISDLVMDANDWQTLYVTDQRSVFVTDDIGNRWTDITGNLQDFAPGVLRSSVFIPGFQRSALVVGTDRGVYVMTTDRAGVWSRLGTGLPNAPVYDMEYDAQDDLLVLGLLGRGAWTMSNVADNLTDAALLNTVRPNRIQGKVVNDLNRDGYRNAGEGGVAGVRVYLDTIENGRFDNGFELSTVTEADGSYSITTPGSARVPLNIEVPANYVRTGGHSLDSYLVGTVRGAYGVNFPLAATANGGGNGGGNGGNGGGNGGNGGGNGGNGGNGGSTQPPVYPGVITGSVYDDSSPTGTAGQRDAGEAGVFGMTAYVDLNNNGIINFNEPFGTTNSAGAFRIANLAAGTYKVRLVPHPGRAFSPLTNFDVAVTAAGTASLSPAFPTTARFDQGGFDSPAHGIVPGFHLGPTVDPDPSSTTADNDGVFFVSGLHPGRTETVAVIANQLSVSPGYLNAWIDFNGDGDWNDTNEQIFQAQRLSTGLNQLTYRVPAAATAGSVFARFRFGFERILNPTSAAFGGELEDYLVTIPSEGDTGINAVDDTAMVAEDSDATSIDVLANDQAGFLGGSLRVVSLGPTSHGGTVTITGGLAVSYQPAPDFSGTETFTYTIQDDFGASDTGLVTVTVTDANDPVVANDDVFDGIVSGSVNNILDVVANDSALPDSTDVLTITSFTSPSGGGNLVIGGGGSTLLYTPATGFQGTETFTYVVSDGRGSEDTATVTVTVVSAVPAVKMRLAVTDNAGNPISNILVGQQFQLRGFVQDISGDDQGVFSAYLDVTYSPSLATAGGNISYGSSYASGQSGSVATAGLIDEIGATDGTTPLGPTERLLFIVPIQAIAEGQLDFVADPADVLPLHETTLFGSTTPIGTSRIQFVNASVFVGVPGVRNDTFTVVEDSSANPLDVLANDLPPAGQGPFVITQTSAPNRGGMVSIEPGGQSLRYTPARDFEGVETFSYTVRDLSGVLSVATVNVNVSNVNDNPVARDDAFFNIPRNSLAIPLDVLANDTILPDSNETLTIVEVTSPSSAGSVIIAAGSQSLTYTPGTGFAGIDEFTYTISDGNGGTSQATVRVLVQDEVDRAAFILEVTDTFGNPITSIQVGQSFLVNVYVQDLRAVPDGVFSAYLDVTFGEGVAVDGALADFQFNSKYPASRLGSVATAGLIDELGAVDGVSGGNIEAKELLVTVPFVANAVGDVLFNGDPADLVPPHETTLFGGGIIPSAEISFMPDNLTVVASASSFGVNNLPWDVNRDGFVAPLDALMIINELSAGGARRLTTQDHQVLTLDVNSDGYLSPLDPLLVINQLSELNGSGSRAASASVVVSQDAPAEEGSQTIDGTGTDGQVSWGSVPGMPAIQRAGASTWDLAENAADDERDAQRTASSHPWEQVLDDLAEEVSTVWRG